jgi:phosphoribosylanthranilate isomerase
VFVKICGVCTPDDARAAADAGADAIGINFWPRSKRYVGGRSFAEAIARAQEIAAAVTVRRYGVFVDADAAEVHRVLDERVIDIVQLHGDETPAYCAAFGPRIMKAIRLQNEGSLARLSEYGGELALIDADAPGYGGSGQRANVELAQRAARVRPVLLAGGLTPENVAAAIAEVKPFGVDVAGGVEASPGVKDARKMAAFIAAAKR